MLDDTGRFEPGEIDHGHEKDRVTARIGKRETQIVAHGKSNRLFAAGALRLDVERQGLISQFPLHEGSRATASVPQAAQSCSPLEKANLWGVGSAVIG